MAYTKRLTVIETDNGDIDIEATMSSLQSQLKDEKSFKSIMIKIGYERANQILLAHYNDRVAPKEANDPEAASLTALGASFKLSGEPEASSVDAQVEKAVNFIFAHNGCLSKDVKKYISEKETRWTYILRKMSSDERLSKKGSRISMRWYAN